MVFRILTFLLLPVICLAQINTNGEKPRGELLSNEVSPIEMKRNASFNLEEIKVRWKKAALENCPGVPCVVAPPTPSFTCGTSTVLDYDGNSYETVAIVGTTQCWTKTNLKVTKYNDGTLIGDSTNNTWGTAMIGARTGYVDPGVTGYVGTFGYLYNWYAATDSRKLCPSGWHVPTDSDWNKLVKFIDSSADTSGVAYQSISAGTLMKSASAFWNVVAPASPGTNTSGFSALPGGWRYLNGGFNFIGDITAFWSANETSSSSGYAWIRMLRGSQDGVERGDADKPIGLAVRCLRD